MLVLVNTATQNPGIVLTVARPASRAYQPNNLTRSYGHLRFRMDPTGHSLFRLRSTGRSGLKPTTNSSGSRPLSPEASPAHLEGSHAT